MTALFLLIVLTLSGSESRMQEILAMFSKSKHVHKQKHGVSKSIFLERHGEPIAGGDVSGIYEVDGLELLTLRLTQSGGEGTDRHGTFTLRDVRRNGALLTATKVYANGRTRKLEGVFMDLVTRAGKTPEDATTTHMRGFGAVLDEPYAVAGGVYLDKVFYARR
ncbi:MAG TPA: hypothetical protein VFV49_14995 [Thermoanaerobaculia bacterium]|nr:hypothetical protein [Thermoanaerobaculia bacterium]